MSILTGEWENWRFKTKKADGTIVTKQTIVYVVRRDRGRMVTWTKESNLDRLNELLYDYEPEERELPAGLYYQYHINMDIERTNDTTDPNLKDEYDDIIDLRFSSKTRIPPNRLMGRMIQEINKLSTSPHNAGLKEGAKDVLKKFNWNSMRSKNQYKLLKHVDMGVTTQPSSRELRFKRKRV